LPPRRSSAVDPYTLHLADAALRGVAPLPRAELLRALRPYAEAQLAQGVPLRHLSRHILGLFHGQPGGRGYRQVLSAGAHRPGAGWALVEQALAATARGAVVA